MRRLIFLFICFFIFNACSRVSEKPTLPQTLERFKTEKIVQKQDLEIKEDKKEKTLEEISLPEYKQVKIKPPTQEEVFDIESIKITEDKVIINADRAPLFDFILYVFGEVLKIPFMIEEDIRNITVPITLRTPEPIPAKDALKMIIEILNKNDIKVSNRGGALYIYKPKTMPSAPPQSVSVSEDIPLGSSNVMQIIPLKYTKSSDLIPIITEAYKGMVTVKAFAKENSVIVTGSGFQIRNIMEFIKTVDVPYLENKKLTLIKLIYWRPEDFVKQLSEILQSIGIPVAKSQNEPGVFLIPIKYLNSFLAVTPDENSKKIVIEWVNKIDTPESAGTEEKIFTYIPLYSRASDLVESVKKLYTGQTTQPQTSTVSPTIKPSELKTPVPQPEKPSPPLNPTVTFDSLKISSDDRRNIVIVITTPSTYKMLLELFKELDRPTRQVLIETVIAEVTLKDDLRYGVEWYIRNKMAEGTYTLQTLGQLGVSTTGGLVFQFVSDTEKFKALINLFAQKNLINILS
ncbi:MAG: secretin N-terminal domain-containing protein, partial [Thermodesulfovibrionaceae bacterium]